MKKKVLLAILDGWGIGSVHSADAIRQASTPFMDSLFQKYPNATLTTFGEDVGLPEGQMGNSEVGHMNIGAGRVVYQELARINKSIKDFELHANPTLLESLKYAKENNKKVHFIGLVSDGGVHSHINHLKALCEISQTVGLDHVFIHAFTDGRDCDPKSGANFLKSLEEHIESSTVKVASVIGRYYAMDRDKRWERVKKAYDLLVNNISTNNLNFDKASEGIEYYYNKGITDEFMEPFLVGDKNASINENDVVISFNFRTDRPREIAEALCQKDFPDYGMKKLSLYYVTMTRYDDTYKGVKIIFEKDDLTETLGEVISNAGLSQVRIAETEKYPHVTFFFSGGREEAFTGEHRILIPSSKEVPTYDLKPEMSAYEICDAITRYMQSDSPDFVCLNFANADMVGHTGVFAAAMKAAETVDNCTKYLVSTALGLGYECIIIADHGNSDFMLNEDKTPNTAHTMNPVPIIFVSEDIMNKSVNSGRLADVAPTILSLLGLQSPKSMTGKNLIN